MYTFINRIVIAIIILFFFSMVSVAEEYTEVKFSVSIWPGFSTVPVTPDNRILTRFSLNILGGRYHKLKGVELGGIYNEQIESMEGVQFSGLVNNVGGDSHGLQWSGLFNNSGGDFYGLQWTGGLNHTKGYFTGLQLAGLINSAEQNSSSLQWAGLFNGCGGNFTGLQWAGLVNATKKNSSSIQWAGLANLVKGNANFIQWAGLINATGGNFNGIEAAGVINACHGNSNGIQIAGVINAVGNYVNGIQIAGVINVAQNVNGVQIAPVNISKKNNGAPIGLLSYVKEIGVKYDIWFSETGQPSIALRSGNETVYNLLMVSTNNLTDEKQWMPGFGIGYVLNKRENYNFSIDATHSKMFFFDGKADRDSNLSKLRIIFGKRFCSGVNMYAGVTWNILNYDGEGLDDIAPYTINDLEFKNGAVHTVMWPGGLIGINF